MHLPPQTTADDFLGALGAAAQASGVKALLLIDALNEGDGRAMWPNYLAGVLETVSRYRWIGIAVSVRSTYEALVIPEETEDRFVKVRHPGFAEHEYDAMKTFFEYYGIERPSTPLLIPEFQTPLFLKMLCVGLNESGQSRIPTGLHGITDTFQLFVT